VIGHLADASPLTRQLGGFIQPTLPYLTFTFYLLFSGTKERGRPHFPVTHLTEKVILDRNYINSPRLPFPLNHALRLLSWQLTALTQPPRDVINTLGSTHNTSSSNQQDDIPDLLRFPFSVYSIFSPFIALISAHAVINILRTILSITYLSDFSFNLLKNPTPTITRQWRLYSPMTLILQGSLRLGLR
jgi:hypothetical protein